MMSTFKLPVSVKLDPKKYGVIVEAGFRRGLLLPDLEGVNSANEQIEICRQKTETDPVPGIWNGHLLAFMEIHKCHGPRSDRKKRWV